MHSSVIALRRWMGPLMVLLAVTVLGCGSSASLAVIKPFKNSPRYHSLTVVGEGNGVAAARAARRLKDLLVTRIERKHLFHSVGPDGDLVLRANVQNVADGREVKRSLTLTGQARATVEIQIQETSGKVVGHLSADSSADRKGEDDDPEERVLTAIADRVVGYLEEQAGKPKPK